MANFGQNELFSASKNVLISLNLLRSRLSWEEQRQLALALNMCLECGGRLKQGKDGEFACSRCGLVWGYNGFDMQVPFPEEAEEKGDFENHWHPPCSLAFLKGLGDTLDLKGVRHVLKRNGWAGIRFRASYARGLKKEPTVLTTMLERLSQILDQAGLRGDPVAADYMGRLARKITAFSRHVGLKLMNGRRLADAIAYYALNRMGKKPPENLEYKPYELLYVHLFVEMEAWIKSRQHEPNF